MGIGPDVPPGSFALQSQEGFPGQVVLVSLHQGNFASFTYSAT